MICLATDIITELKIYNTKVNWSACEITLLLCWYLLSACCVSSFQNKYLLEIFHFLSNNYQKLDQNWDCKSVYFHGSWFFALEFLTDVTQFCGISTCEALFSPEFPMVNKVSNLKFQGVFQNSMSSNLPPPSLQFFWNNQLHLSIVLF